VFSLGGDGTVLYAARLFSPLNVPILPVNMGTLGFISAVEQADALRLFGAWAEKSALPSRRLMIEVSVERDGELMFISPALNDAVISSDGISKLIRLGVSSGEEPLDMGDFRSDGLIVATATGSTAYSSAAGGPLLDPEMEALIINPICPFTLANRPIVVMANDRRKKVTVHVEREQRSGVLLTIDGQVTKKLLPDDRVIITRAPYKALLVGAGRRNFFQALRGKLSWSGGEQNAG
jgi:NAD+ kinase